MFSLLIKQTNKLNMEKELYTVEMIPIDKVLPNPFQPRTNFDEKLIEGLAESIKNYGLLQPIIVRKRGEVYYLIAGERRLRACKHLGFEEIKAIVINVTDIESAILALIENIQRQDLDFFEEAQGYKQLIEEFSLTQVEIAKRVGKTQSAIANKIRLLSLPQEIRWIIRENELSERHARALLKLESEEDMKYILSKIIENGLTVAQTERLISEYLNNKKVTKNGKVIKVSMNDCRVIYNTIKKALKIFQKTDINYDIRENKTEAYYEIIVRINKKSPQTSS